MSEMWGPRAHPERCHEWADDDQDPNPHISGPALFLVCVVSYAVLALDWPLRLFFWLRRR